LQTKKKIELGKHIISSIGNVIPELEQILKKAFNRITMALGYLPGKKTFYLKTLIIG
jgi:hypothetical protein